MPAPLVLPAPSPPAPSTTQGSTFNYMVKLDTMPPGQHNKSECKKLRKLGSFLKPRAAENAFSRVR